MFRPLLMARVLIVSAVLGVGLIVALKAANPLLQLPPLWKLVLAFPTTYAYFALMLAVHIALPTHVTACEKRLHAMTGQSHWGVEAAAVTRTRITVFATDRVRLRVYFDRKGKARSRVFGVARKVDLDMLADVLPVYPEVRDARSRYDRPQTRRGRVISNVTVEPILHGDAISTVGSAWPCAGSGNCVRFGC